MKRGREAAERIRSRHQISQARFVVPTGSDSIKRGLIVGCYTPGDYAQVAEEHLIGSVRSSGLPFDIREMPNRGSWVLNNSACQLFLLQMHLEKPDTDFLYIDVDGVVRSDPWPILQGVECDVAAYYLRGIELLSGTLFLPARPRREELLRRWIEKNEKNPHEWDQRNLQKLLREDPSFVSCTLPAEMCCIFDIQRAYTPSIVPIIEHFQASRKFRRRVQPLK